MIFFGWGRKNRTWSVGDGGQHLVASWGYVHLFWCPIAGKVTWHLQGHDRREDAVLSYEEVKRRFPTDTPKIGSWQRFGLLYAIAVVWIITRFTA